MPSDSGRDKTQTAIHAGVFILFSYMALLILGTLLSGLNTQVLSATLVVFASGLMPNWLCLSIFEHRPFADCGLWLNSCSGHNLLWGLAGGAGAVAVVMLPLILAGAGHFVALPAEPPSAGTIIFVILMLAGGALGEEMLFRGYGLQILIDAFGAWATILPVGAVFGILHLQNPNASLLSSVITAGFGVLFGYAFLLSRDLWLPLGLHFGWNFTLPLFGVNISGLRIRLTGYEMSWTAGNLWSGGEYGPEASILTIPVIVLLLPHPNPHRRRPRPARPGRTLMP